MITLDALELPYELVWIDEYDWTRVVAKKTVTLGGVLKIETSKFQSNSGRQVTLFSKEAWITKAALDTLHSWAMEEGKTMTLVLHDLRSFQVQFQHWSIPVIDAKPIKQIAEQAGTDYYVLRLKLVITPVG